VPTSPNRLITSSPYNAFKLTRLRKERVTSYTHRESSSIYWPFTSVCILYCRDDVPNRNFISACSCRIWGFHGVTVNNAIFCDVTPCGFCNNRRFGGTYLLHYQGEKIILLRIVPRLLVTANIVPSWQMFVTLMTEVIHSSDTLVLTRATRCNISANGILHLMCGLIFEVMKCTPSRINTSSICLYGGLS
jgi:hypothetical protein